MKIAAARVDAFIKAPSPGLIGVLIYGPDIGLVSEHASKLAGAIVSDPFSIVEISSDKLQEDPAILADEISAISFFGGRKLIKIRDPGSGVSQIFRDAFSCVSQAAAENSFVLVTAGELTPASALRRLFENEKTLAALPCYHDDERSLRPAVATIFRERNLLPANGVVDYISSHCLGDRLIAQREIEKLILYIGEKEEISLEDAEICIGDTTESSFDDINFSVAEGNYSGLEKHLHKALKQGISAVAILRLVQRYFMRIHCVIGAIQEGKGQELAIKNLRPPVFFKQLPFFKRHIERWNKKPDLLWRVMKTLYDAELECKKTGVDPDLICSRFLMRVTALSHSIR